jgi:hypothetical protein
MRIYRLYRRDPIIKGNWYYYVLCHNCRTPVYFLDAPSNENSTTSIFETSVSVPCTVCKHDDIYENSLIMVRKADRNAKGQRPKRVAVSKSPRKPLLSAYPKAKAVMGIGLVEGRPQAASIIGRIITAWADIEIECARLLGELMEITLPSAAAVFGSIRSSRAQHDALAAAAKVSLSDRDFELFSAYMHRKSSLEKERNDLAHGCLGVSIAIPDHIIWVSQSDYLTFMSKFPHDQQALQKFREKQFVYELGTLERIAQEIQQFHEQLGSFIGYLYARKEGDNGQKFRGWRYFNLCEEDHIKQSLATIRSPKR